MGRDSLGDDGGIRGVATGRKVGLRGKSDADFPPKPGSKLPEAGFRHNALARGWGLRGRGRKARPVPMAAGKILGSPRAKALGRGPGRAAPGLKP